MQFGPEANEKLRKPAANGAEAMAPGVTSGAQSDEQLDAVETGNAVMHR